MYGMCHSRSQHHDRWETQVADDRGAVLVADRDRSERIGDADRERAAAVLSQAFRDGVLRVEEFDERLSAAYAAATVGDLEDVMHDLPRDWAAQLRTSEQAARRADLHRRGWRTGFQTYLRVMALLVGIWFLTSLGDFQPGGEEPYFWPMWPILGWGIPLFVSRPRGRPTGRVDQPPLARTR